jgi:hypothetical protein
MAQSVQRVSARKNPEAKLHANITTKLVLDAFNSGLDTSDIALICNVTEASVYNLLASMDGEVAP